MELELIKEPEQEPTEKPTPPPLSSDVNERLLELINTIDELKKENKLQMEKIEQLKLSMLNKQEPTPQPSPTPKKPYKYGDF